MMGVGGDSGTQGRGEASCCHGGLDGLLEEATSKLRPEGGQGFTWQNEQRIGSQGRRQLFLDLQTGPGGQSDHERTARW